MQSQHQRSKNKKESLRIKKITTVLSFLLLQQKHLLSRRFDLLLCVWFVPQQFGTHPPFLCISKSCETLRCEVTCCYLSKFKRGRKNGLQLLFFHLPAFTNFWMLQNGQISKVDDHLDIPNQYHTSIHSPSFLTVSLFSPPTAEVWKDLLLFSAVTQ